MELLKYFDSRFKKSEPKKFKKHPFITISRETGCGAVDIAKLLIKELKSRGEQWKYIDKDILFDSAKRLKLDQSKINYIFEAKTKTHADEILSALSNKYYKSDRAVRKTIADVVTHFAEEGRIILIGRAGAAITANMKKSTHVRLVAPIGWRIDSLMKRRKETHSDTEKYILDVDKKRQKLMTFFCKKKPQDICFDITINCAKFSRKQIVEIIINTLEQRKLI